MEIECCRVCLSTQSTLVSLYESENEGVILNLLEFCVSVIVSNLSLISNQINNI